MTTAFYTRIDDSTFESSPLTSGPWGPHSQHAGPPSALLARAFETFEPRADARLARLHVDILGPVPIAPLTITVEPVRPGRSIELLQAVVSAGGKDVLLGRAWRMTRAPEEMPEIDAPGDGQEVPDAVDFVMPEMHQDGYLSAVDWRYSRGGYGESGLVTAWLRPRIPLVDGEELSGWQRALVVADSASGVSMPVDPKRTPAINTDLSVALTREPRSEWIRLDAQTTIVPGGGAHTAARIGDEYGPIGHGSQAMFSRVLS